MIDFILACIGQILPFLPLAYAISLSFNILQTTDLALDASFIIGAGFSAKLIAAGYNPVLALAVAVLCGAVAGCITSLIQYKSRINGLLASILSSFILLNIVWIIMDRPNISLLDQKTILNVIQFKSEALASQQDLIMMSLYAVIGCVIIYLIVSFSRLGILMAGLGSNQKLLNNLGYNTELLRALCFAVTNALAAFAGVLTSSSVGYADVNMSLGLTLTGIGAVIIGQTIIKNFFHTPYKYRVGVQFISCLFGVTLYFCVINTLLRYGVNPLYIKMLVGIMLVMFLYLSATRNSYEKS